MDSIKKVYSNLNNKKKSKGAVPKVSRNLIITAVVFFLMSGLISLSMVIFSAVYIFYNMYYNKENFKPSTNSEAEDERIENYYINSDIHRDQGLLLQRFLDLLC
tara:strand:- start:3386 stop:3697 length:312 start_codon:yes stop_codon:yes gene_type:complete